tara:strand:- start:2878 stop:3633 length:756 start_codon:yes stop_codon:yes gene_type:complete
MANTLAYNHLAKHGRSHPDGGPRDTEMYKTSKLGPGKGKVWHVNDDEKRLMNMYGLRGEKLVDAVGSGTINPKTGKEEKFFIAAATLALGAYGAYKSGSIQEKQAGAAKDAAQKGLEATQEAEGKLSESANASRELLGAQMKREYGEMGKQLGVSEKQIIEATSKASGKTGFALSGDVEASGKEALDAMREKGDYSREGMMGEYGQKLGEITSGYMQEKARLKADKEKFTREISLAGDMEGSWYLGKGIGG